jgi:hypothetical protein
MLQGASHKMKMSVWNENIEIGKSRPHRYGPFHNALKESFQKIGFLIRHESSLCNQTIGQSFFDD